MKKHGPHMTNSALLLAGGFWRAKEKSGVGKVD